MSNTDKITAKGTVVKVETGRFFRIKLDNDHTALCYKSGKMTINRIYLTVGDRVRVELSAYDLTRGRITYREN